MLTTQLMYGLTGCLIAGLGLRTALLSASLLQRILAINVLGAGVFMLLIAVAYRGPGLAPDPVPHALVLTGIVVAVSATALALSLARRLHAGLAANRCNCDTADATPGNDDSYWYRNRNQCGCRPADL